MSRRPLSKEEIPRDKHVVQALRRELNHNTQRISQSFWQEFEQIRNNQRNQLASETANRERITEIMNETNQEAQRQIDALSRSISSHGINPLAPSPIMRTELPAPQVQEERPPQQAKKSPGRARILPKQPKEQKQQEQQQQDKNQKQKKRSRISQNPLPPTTILPGRTNAQPPPKPVSLLAQSKHQKSPQQSNKPTVSNISTPKTPSLSSAVLPRAPPASRETLPAGAATLPNFSTPPRNNPVLSKLQLANKSIK